jgi:hypothetical protein
MIVAGLRFIAAPPDLEERATALLGALTVWIIAHGFGWLVWRIRGREYGAGRATYAILVGLMVFGALGRFGTQLNSLPAGGVPSALLPVTSQVLNAHYADHAQTPAEADIPTTVSARLAAFDAAAAKETTPEAKTRYAAVRAILAPGIESDLRVGAAIDALVVASPNRWEAAKDPAAMAAMKSANAAFEAAAEQRYASDEARAESIATLLQSPAFSAAEQEQLKPMFRQVSMADARITAQVSAVRDLERANAAAFDFLVANPGTWRVENGEVRFNNGLLAQDFAPLRNALDAARARIAKMVEQARAEEAG